MHFMCDVLVYGNESKHCWNRSVLGEKTNINYFNELPFQTFTNYDFETDFI